MKYAILHNIRSAHNVGSIFRTCDAAGVSRIILAGYTPAPTDRFGRTQSDIAKTSLGASEMVPWEKIDNEASVLVKVAQLKESGFTIAALEQTENAVSLYDFVVPQQVAYIVGNEIEGVSPALLSMCDTVIEIPMQGKKESLNVAVATGILLFHR